jgi:hypothetical protein
MPTVRNYKALLAGQSWAGQDIVKTPAVITYSFPTKVQSYLKSEGGYSSAAIRSWRPLESSERQIVEASLRSWSAIAGVKFVKVAPGEGDMTFSKLNFDLTPSSGAWGFAYYPSRSGDEESSFAWRVGGDSFFNTQTGFNMATVAHEIGHTLGLKHPFEGSVRLDSSLDTRSNTVMSYTGSGGDRPGELDIDAMRHIYGPSSPAAGTLTSHKWNAQTSTLTQNWGNKSSQIGGTSSKDSIAAGGGNDTVSGFLGNDTLKGGSGNDLLFGNEGNEIFQPGQGDDTIYGGNYHGDTRGGSDTVDYSGTNTAVTIEVVGFWSGGTQSTATGAGVGTDQMYDIEHFITGGGDDVVEGNDASNWIRTNRGNDSLFGGRGRDSLDGGLGNDTLKGGHAHDVFVYSHGGDLIQDWKDDQDTIRLDRKLWTGTLGIDDVIAAFATVGTSETVFDFGGGNVLTVAGLTDLAILRNDLEIV